MRNKFPGTCYRCGQRVETGEGHFERFRGGWRTQHASCAIECRGTPDPEREKDRINRLKYIATLTGRKAQKARAALRAMEATDAR